jgi:hypothetical protein
MSSAKEAAFDGLLAFLQAVSEAADAFGPLKSAAGGAVHLMEVVKVSQSCYHCT